MSQDKIHGNLKGLGKQKKDEISRLLRRRLPPGEITTQEFSRELCGLSSSVGRQIGVLVNRRGQVERVMVGDAGSIMLPDLGRSRGDASRFRGLRYLHTHLAQEPLNDDDLTDLILLRFDLVLAVAVDEEGFPGPSFLAHLLPENPEGKTVETYPPFAPGRLDIDFLDLMRSLEEEFARSRPPLKGKGKEGVILTGIVLAGEKDASAENGIDGLAELRELARSAGVDVLAEMAQRRQKIHPRTVIGPGKIRELVMKAMQLGAVTLIFDRELTPAQVNSLQKITELKVIDRSQLILDIFAQRAKTREGKIQVELAQLRYNLPRLVGRGVDMSRLMGGIGGRGPGETKLEIDRRRVRERIGRLEKDLENMRRTRVQKRERRVSRGVPVVSIVGYTNAGKSTLLNQLTDGAVDVEDKLFATLDPTSRRLRFPREREIIVTDTVGFIHELPRDLYEAFRATLEELEDADLFIHVVDASDPSWEGQVKAVERILEDLELIGVPRVLAFNKVDKIEPFERNLRLSLRPGSVAVSALDRKTLRPLLEAVEKALFEDNDRQAEAWASLGF